MHHYTANLSYRVQIFLYSLLLIIIPTTLLSISAATKMPLRSLQSTVIP